MNCTKLRQKIEQKKGARDQIERDLIAVQKEVKKIEKDITFTEKAQAIIIAVAKLTQEELEFRIAEPVSLALQAIFDNPYKMVTKFDITGRGATECQLRFERNGNLKRPFDASGGGPIDVACFALRVGSLTLEIPKRRRVLILDEPFRFVSHEKMPFVGQLLQEISKELNLQIIMVTHISELTENCDKVFEVSIKNGISTVKELSETKER